MLGFFSLGGVVEADDENDIRPELSDDDEDGDDDEDEEEEKCRRRQLTKSIDDSQLQGCCCLPACLPSSHKDLGLRPSNKHLDRKLGLFSHLRSAEEGAGAGVALLEPAFLAREYTSPAFICH